MIGLASQIEGLFRFVISVGPQIDGTPNSKSTSNNFFICKHNLFDTFVNNCKIIPIQAI